MPVQILFSLDASLCTNLLVHTSYDAGHTKSSTSLPKTCYLDACSPHVGVDSRNISRHHQLADDGGRNPVTVYAAST